MTLLYSLLILIGYLFLGFLFLHEMDVPPLKVIFFWPVIFLLVVLLILCQMASELVDFFRRLERNCHMKKKKTF